METIDITPEDNNKSLAEIQTEGPLKLHSTIQALTNCFADHISQNSSNLHEQIKIENSVQTFWHEQLGDLTVFKIDGESWFVGKEVTDKLGYTESNDAIEAYCPNVVSLNYWELKKIAGDTGNSPATKFDVSRFKGGCSLIPRDDLFSLVNGSKKPDAKILQTWVNSHILPSIQDTGQYTMVTHPEAQKRALAQGQGPAPQAALIELIKGLQESVDEYTKYLRKYVVHKDNEVLEKIKVEALVSTATNEKLPDYLTVAQLGEFYFNLKLNLMYEMLECVGLLERDKKYKNGWKLTTAGEDFRYISPNPQFQGKPNSKVIKFVPHVVSYIKHCNVENFRRRNRGEINDTLLRFDADMLKELFSD